VKKRKSRRETATMIQTAVWLPREMHERLRKAGGQRGMGEEIRRLLEGSLEEVETPPDEITGELLDQVREIATDLSRDQPLWVDPLTYEAFKVAVEDLLTSHKPSGEAQPETRAKFEATYGDEDPQRVGRMMARRAQFAYGRERWGQAVLDMLKVPKG
jgi:hypothetical protein